MQQSLAVFRQNPALLYQIVHRFCVAADVIFPTGIPFSDGLARITQFPTLGGTSPSDRKSTRLNSSHVAISYAVFCLKKKNKKYHGLHHKSHMTPQRTIPDEVSAR